MTNEIAETKAVCPAVESVREQLKQRAEMGLEKYGQTVTNNPLPLIEWLQHLQEEMMDACVYIERIKQSEAKNE